MFKTSDPKGLFDALLRADSESEVVTILTEAGFWNDKAAWRDLGDEPENYSTVGSQQSRAEQALIEKLVNSVDTKLISAAWQHDVNPESSSAPQTMLAARDAFFETEMKNPEALSRGITVAATGARAPGRPSISIADNGEGQTPTSMPHTILSVLKGSKKRVPFVQGKFHMGGTGVLEFCGREHNVQLVVSRRNPNLLKQPLADASDADWSFTIVRREDPIPGSRSSHFTFLAPGPVGSDGKKGLLHFAAQPMPIFPEKNKAYAREGEWGTLFKLYEYGIRQKTNMMLADGLMRRVSLLLPEPALPIRFHECRAGFKGDPERSFDTTMIGLIGTLDEDRRNPKRDNVEWFDKFDMVVEGQQFAGRIYVFKDKDAADGYRRDEGVVFTYNGQAHAIFTKDFFRRKAVKQDYLWHSLLVFVDCSAVSPRGHEMLFMASRDRLRDSDLTKALVQELEDKLKTNQKLKELAIERRNRERAAQPEVSETFRNFLEELVKKNPLLAAVLGPGFRIRNPHKPVGVAEEPRDWKGHRFPTRFTFKGQQAEFELSRDAYQNSKIRIALETDAEDEYFSREEEPGSFTLFQIVDGQRVLAANWRSPSLFQGAANLTLGLPTNNAVGDALTFEAETTDPSRTEPFVNRFTLKVKAERPEVEPTPRPKTKSQPPSDTPGTERQDDTQLDIPDPTEVYERDWGNHEPPFTRTTAMIIKESPTSDEQVTSYDYYVNMDNVFLQGAQKERPKKAAIFKSRFKHGMTLIALAMIQHDMGRTPTSAEDQDSEENQGVADVRDVVRDVSTALAPFLLPLVESLSQINEEDEEMSGSAGEAG